MGSISRIKGLIKKVKDSQDPNVYRDKVNSEKGEFEQIKNTEEVETNKTGIGADDTKIDFKKPYNNTQIKTDGDDLKKMLQRR